ncbi:quinolinate synthase NadA [bacterium]|nr:quinolinate synthase NadA [bacterium]
MLNQQLREKIQKLKEKRNAVILAHSYQIKEIQEIADFVGGSLALSYKAAQTQAKVILFCGVRFMAETASILCPDKIILLPDINAGCPLADMVTAKDLRELKKKNPQVKIVVYVNSTAEVKAEADVCCTSGNAVSVVESLKNMGEIVFVPDKNLGSFVKKKTKRNITLWNGFCPVHVKISAKDIENKKKLYPDAKIIVHPECIPEVVDMAEEGLSTGGMCKYARENTKIKQIVVGTEIGLLHKLRRENPEKDFFPASESVICPDMKLITLEKVYWALENMKYEIKISSDLRFKAKKAVDEMLRILPQ